MVTVVLNGIGVTITIGMVVIKMLYVGELFGD
jgi:hypothetical protein